MSVTNPLRGTLLGMIGKLKFDITVQAIAAEYTILADAPSLVFLHPSTAVDCLLPPEADAKGHVYIICNDADDASAITVKDDGDSVTVASIGQNEMVIVACDGVGWNSLVGTTT